MKVVVNNTDQNSIKEKADMQKGNPNKTKHWFFKKINKIDKFYQARLIKEKKTIQITNIRNKRDITTDPKDIKNKDIMNNFVNKFDNLEEMDKVLEKHNLLKLI